MIRPHMKLYSWNINGIRACHKGGFLDWFKKSEAEVVCVQEIKATLEQLGPELHHPNSYHSFWHSAKKPGYSGVATYSKTEPLNISYGIGVPEIDDEGRILTTEFKNFTLINAYFPNSQRDHKRLKYKLKFCDEMLKYTQSLRKKGKFVVLCGDYNIAHKPIDLKNPKSNETNAGFLPEERAWMDKFLAAGYVDTFRNFTPDPDHYTWWSYRPGVRERNVGWRIDYFCTNEEFKDRLKASTILPQVRGSDHCPVSLELRA